MESLLEDLRSDDEERTKKALANFVETNEKIFQFPELSNATLRKALWTALWNLINTSTDADIWKNCFAAIRILSREKSSLNELIDEQWFNVIKRHAGIDDPDFTFTEEQMPVAVEALKALCNIIYNSSVGVAMCCKNQILEGVCKRLRKFSDDSVPRDIKFFDMRLLFLITALCPEVRGQLCHDLNVLELLVEALDCILKQAAESVAKDVESPKIKLDDEQVDMVCEILKALFNLTLNLDEDSDEEKAKYISMVALLKLYLLVPVDNKEKLVTLQSNLINLLTNMPCYAYGALITPLQPGQKLSPKLQFEDQNMTAIYEILKFLEGRFIDGVQTSEQVLVLSPVITLLLKCAKSYRAIRKYLRMAILPPLKDVYRRPEEGDTLRNNLCRLLTSPMTRVKDLSAQLVFVLCKMNVNRMIKYTGYGNAAGLFAQRGLLGGKPDQGEADFSSDSEDSETEEYAENKHLINPVTGCYEEPHANPMENMTEEQKEYEAMKLVELIDNLTRCGAIRPCRVGADGKPHPIEHVLQLQEGLEKQQISNKNGCGDDDQDSD